MSWITAGTRLIEKLKMLGPFIETQYLRRSSGKRSRKPPPGMMRSSYPVPSVWRTKAQGEEFPDGPASSAVAEPASPNSSETDRSLSSANRAGVSPCRTRALRMPPWEIMRAPR